MPQAPTHLAEEFPDDGAAFEQLIGNFTVSRGGVISPLPGYTLTDRDKRAVDYLILEWDYVYSGNPPEVPPAPAGTQS